MFNKSCTQLDLPVLFSGMILLFCTIHVSIAASDIECRLAALEKQGKEHVQLLTTQAHEIKQLQDELQRTQDEIQIYKRQTKHQTEQIRQLKLQVPVHNNILEEYSQEVIDDRAGKATDKQMTRKEEHNDSTVHSGKADRPDISNVSSRNTRYVVESQRMSRKRLELRGASEGIVAFYATTDKQEIRHMGKSIVLDLALLNLGNGYHNQTGIFTAPLDGVYLFSASIRTFYDQSRLYVGLQVGIMKNGIELGNVYVQADNSSYGLGQSAVTVVTQLVKGDAAWLRIDWPVDALLYGLRSTSFCGYLIH